MASFHLWNREANNEALAFFYRAIELDHNFASAYGMAARCYLQRKASGWMADRASEIAETARLARQAGQLGKDDAVALATAGMSLAFVVGDIVDGSAFIERALALNPNLALAWLFSGWVRVWLGEPEIAIERVTRALRLSPHDPQIVSMQCAMAAAHLFAGRYDEAWSWAEAAVREQPNMLLASCVAAASAALAGHLSEVGKEMTHLRQLDPGLSVSNLKDVFPIRRSDDFDRLADALRRAGLPE
jgi:tetratricopeptide (TPR) repeat protein